MKKQSRKNQFVNAYEEYSDAIFRHCYFRLSNRERAMEIMQEVFMKTWKSMENQKVKNIRALLYKIANNMVIDEYRKRKNTNLSLDKLHESGFTVSTTEHETIQKKIEGGDMLYILENIDEKYKEVTIMRYIDDLSPKEIAEIIGESENVISVRIHRALKKVRRIVKKQEKEAEERRT